MSEEALGGGVTQAGWVSAKMEGGGADAGGVTALDEQRQRLVSSMGCSARTSFSPRCRDY